MSFILGCVEDIQVKKRSLNEEIMQLTLIILTKACSQYKHKTELFLTRNFKLSSWFGCIRLDPTALYLSKTIHHIIFDFQI